MSDSLIRYCSTHPRAGFRELSILVDRIEAQRVVYVSCNPATMQRDMQPLVDVGWVVQRLVPYDLFPHTGHVEIVGLLERPLLESAR